MDDIDLDFYRLLLFLQRPKNHDALLLTDQFSVVKVSQYAMLGRDISHSWYAGGALLKTRPSPLATYQTIGFICKHEMLVLLIIFSGFLVDLDAKS